MNRLFILSAIAGLLVACSSNREIETTGGTWSDIHTPATTGVGAAGAGSEIGNGGSGTSDTGGVNSTNRLDGGGGY